jgi:hypothetical protein
VRGQRCRPLRQLRASRQRPLIGPLATSRLNEPVWPPETRDSRRASG